MPVTMVPIAVAAMVVAAVAASVPAAMGPTIVAEASGQAEDSRGHQDEGAGIRKRVTHDRLLRHGANLAAGRPSDYAPQRPEVPRVLCALTARGRPVPISRPV